jgi:hypothetical protein
MVVFSGATGDLLAHAAGYAVVDDDGDVGTVETPLFPSDSREPDFLVLRVRARRPIVSCALVEDVDPAHRIVRLRGNRRDILRLPEHVPIAI